MALAPYSIDPDITRAHTLPGAFYHDPAVFALLRERVFSRTWQWLGPLDDVASPGTVSPRSLLPEMLAEPLLLSRDCAGELRCLSNVCTHRGNILVKQAGPASQIRCGYHSRRFDMAGRMTFMPEFSAACDFPSASDHLARVPFGAWQGHGFAALSPAAPLDDFIGPMMQRLAWLPASRFEFDAALSRDYLIDANWALYVENYLEGFHIPFVHAGLNQAVDYGSYSSELHRYGNLQLAMARHGDAAFALPPGTPDYGQAVAAYYYWIFPNLMLNFYPWGLSLNFVEPVDIGTTRVAFRTYVWDRARMEQGAGAALHQVEMEDEAIVREVQRGTRAASYGRGRYSPTREQGTHQFHRLLCEFLYGKTLAHPGALMEEVE